MTWTLPAREQIAAEMLGVVRQHISNAWFPRCIDRERGGFFSQFDRAWRQNGPQHRMLEFQARQARAAARLSIAFPGEAQWAEIALHGFRYLRDKMWDHTHGGWFSMMSRDGEPLEGATKHSHGTSYAVGACAVVYAATGEPEALELALTGFDWFDRRAHDEEYGGYRDWLRRDGTLITEAEAGVSIRLGYPVNSKDINCHHDWVEAFTEFMSVRHEARVEERLREVLRLILRHMVTEHGAVHNVAHRDWSPQPGFELYGHCLQTANCIAACREFCDDPAAADVAVERMADHAISRGWASDGGGIWFAGPSGPPDVLETIPLVVRRRAWWVQLEGLLLLATLVPRVDAEKRSMYTDLFGRLWAFIKSDLADDVYGGFYPTSPRDLPWTERPRGRWGRSYELRKGHLWKDASHDTDDLLDCIRLLTDKPTGAI